MNDTQNPLGEPTPFPQAYDASLLFPIARTETRAALDVPKGCSMPMSYGADYWTAFEFSWLNPQGRVEVAVLQFALPASSPNIIESKSVKLYLASLAQHQFSSTAEVKRTLAADLGLAAGGSTEMAMNIELLSPDEAKVGAVEGGECIDDLAQEITAYQRDPNLLKLPAKDTETTATLYSHSFRSLCPVTGQPDFATIIISYQGPAIDPASLSAYLTSYRLHQGFHEFTVEQIYADLWLGCRCNELLVRGQFLRRGGIDISPYRSSTTGARPRLRLSRQ